MSERPAFPDELIDGTPSEAKRSLRSFLGVFAPPINPAPPQAAVWRAVTRFQAFCPGVGCDYQFPEDQYHPWDGEDFEVAEWAGVRGCPRCGQDVTGDATTVGDRAEADARRG